MVVPKQPNPNTWEIEVLDETSNMYIFVNKYDHKMYKLNYRIDYDSFNIEIWKDIGWVEVSRHSYKTFNECKDYCKKLNKYL